MKTEYKIGTLFNVPIYLEISFIIFLSIVLIFSGIKSALLLLILFSIVLLHEFGHVFAAKSCNIPTDKITLSVLGGVASLSSKFFNAKPKEELFIAISGPMVNVALALFAYPIWLVLKDYENLKYINDFIFWFYAVNCALFVFNMIPAFPMDGGRILRSLLGFKFSHLTATKIAVITSWVFCGLMFITGILVFNFILSFISIFIALIAYGELLRVLLRVKRKTGERYV